MSFHNVNPTVKALTILAVVFVLALRYDPVTPAVFSAATIAVTFLFGNVNKKLYVIYLMIFSIFSFGMLWTTIAFADVPADAKETVSLFGWVVPKEDWLMALSLSFRIIAFASLSLLFVFTTNMVEFLLSLMQQLRLPPKLAYGILAGYRFLPMMKDEFQQIRAAHRIRGIEYASSLQGRWMQYQRYLIPLLAGAIRKAERTAVAMESKGFTGSWNRTFYRPMTIRKKDWMFPLLMTAILMGSILI
ncbi:energy-coupling factor transporter transmembrane component T [Halobacillus sp. ACCC02827]|uniref:energy-coupling factor transporter transmembrane component T family protein n=1 Tax=Halobacillus sp. ACCC02827 TaxID=3052090 RepID=UPI00257074C1|nr:energy-coupling factor transporter transmembrane component T [Halobacillus sp. ACCC02827]WJE14203.1 energy-coupling factor transporter transmembrane component T [Halobacillus sp. ACCC02827]